MLRRLFRAARRHSRNNESDLAATQALIERTQTSVDALVEVANPTVEQETELQALEGRLREPPIDVHNIAVVLIGQRDEPAHGAGSAAPPTSPVSPRNSLNTLLAAALGMLVVIGVAFVAEQLDDRIKDPDAVQEVAGLSTLGTIAPEIRQQPRAKGVLPARWPPLSSLELRGGLPDAAHEYRSVP